jgi:hypothetical protein
MIKQLDRLDGQKIRMVEKLKGWMVGKSERESYESLNDNLKLVLITRAFKQNSHPKICVVYRGTLISLP